MSTIMAIKKELDNYQERWEIMIGISNKTIQLMSDKCLYKLKYRLEQESDTNTTKGWKLDIIYKEIARRNL